MPLYFVMISVADRPHGYDTEFEESAEGKIYQIMYVFNIHVALHIYFHYIVFTEDGDQWIDEDDCLPDGEVAENDALKSYMDLESGGKRNS